MRSGRAEGAAAAEFEAEALPPCRDSSISPPLVASKRSLSRDILAWPAEEEEEEEEEADDEDDEGEDDGRRLSPAPFPLGPTNKGFTQA